MGEYDSSGKEKFILGNQQRIDKVDQRSEENLPTHYYHISPKKFRVGDHITGINHMKISLSDSPVPHHTIAGERVLSADYYREGAIEDGKWKPEWDGKWYSYEVDPVGSVFFHPELGELQCVSATVIRFVGDARSLLKHQLDKYKSHGKDIEKISWGSRVRGTKNIRRGRHKVIGKF